MEIILEIIYFALTILTLAIIYQLILQHKNSNIGNFLTYSFAGVLFLGVIRLFFAAVDHGFLHIEEVTVMICWHLMFYLTMGLFLIATRSLVAVLDINNPPNSEFKPLYTSLLTGLAIGLIFYFAPLIELKISPLVEGGWIDMSGLAHFIAFAFAARVAYFLSTIKVKYSGSLGAIATPLMGSLAILSLIHLFELLVESWHLFTVPGEGGEVIEALLWVPVFIFVAVAYWKLKKTLSVNT